jgi:hypothetical protein
MNMSATEVMGWQAVKVLRKKPWVKSMLFHGIRVWESKYVEGLPWYAGMAVSLILTGLKPNGIVGEHLLAWYENSVGEHDLQKVSFFWLHSTSVSDPSMHLLHGTQVNEPDDCGT